MMLFTKEGVPLQVVHDKVYSRSGTIVGRIKDDKVFGTDGAYVGTILRDRLVYRSGDRARRNGMFSAGNRMATALGYRCVSSIMGEEPDIPE